MTSTPFDEAIAAAERLGLVVKLAREHSPHGIRLIVVVLSDTDAPQEVGEVQRVVLQRVVDEDELPRWRTPVGLISRFGAPLDFWVHK